MHGLGPHVLCPSAWTRVATSHRSLTARVWAASSTPPYVNFLAAFDDELDEDADLAMASAPCFLTLASAAATSANLFLYSGVCRRCANKEHRCSMDLDCGGRISLLIQAHKQTIQKIIP